MCNSRRQFKSIEELESNFVASLNKAFGSKTYQIRMAAKFIYVKCIVLNCDCSIKFAEKQGTITCVQKIAQYHDLKAHHFGVLKQEARVPEQKLVKTFSRQATAPVEHELTISEQVDKLKGMLVEKTEQHN